MFLFFVLKDCSILGQKGTVIPNWMFRFSNDSASVKADILFRLLPTHLNRLEENPMRRETKALLQENNQQESLLSPDFQSALTNMMTYLRATRLPYSLQEQARRQITQLFLTAQKQGLSPDEAIGMDCKVYCDTLLEQFPQNNRHTRILCAIRDVALFLGIGTAILFLTDVVTALLTPNHSFPLQIGKLIFLLSLVVFAFSFLKNAGKNAFSPAEKQKSFEKNLHFLALFLGIACIFFLKNPSWEIPFWIPLTVVVILFICYGLLNHFLD